MSLDNYNIPAHIRITPTEKNYFNKYAFRVEFTVDKSLLIADTNPKKTWRLSNNWTNFREVKQQLAAALGTALDVAEAKLGSDIDCRMRSEGYGINIYFSDAQMLDIFVNTADLVPLIRQITAPINQQHLDGLQINKVTRYRKSLFLKKYPYKVYMPETVKLAVDFKKIKQWVTETYNDDIERVELNSNLRRAFKGVQMHNRWSCTHVMYLADETDLMMCQLRLHEHISLVEHAVLLSNLEVLAT